MSKENKNGKLNEEKKTDRTEKTEKTKNDRKNKEIMVIAGILVLVLAIWGITALVSDKGSNTDSVKNEGSVQQAEQTLRPDAKPTFKFFYNSSDEKAAELMAVLEELQQTYGDRVIFDISDLDEHPEYVEQFSIMAAPQLYMLRADGNFADIKMGVYDKAELEDAISKVFK